MKNKILAILLIGFLASCTKEEIKPIPVTINGTWRIEGLSNTYTIDLSDSSFTKVANNNKIVERCFILKFNRIKINNIIYNCQFDDHNLMIGTNEYYR